MKKYIKKYIIAGISLSTLITGAGLTHLISQSRENSIYKGNTPSEKVPLTTFFIEHTDGHDRVEASLYAEPGSVLGKTKYSLSITWQDYATLGTIAGVTPILDWNGLQPELAGHGTWETFDIQFMGGPPTISWESSHQGSFMINFENLNSGKQEYLFFEGLGHRYAPSMKFQLQKSEGNNNPWRDLSRFEDWGEFPSQSGDFDLIIDFREPYMQKRHKFGPNYGDRPEEFFNLNNWRTAEGSNMKLNFEIGSLFYNISTKNIDTGVITKKVPNTYINGNYEIGGTNNPHNATFEMLDDGYTRIRFTDVITVNEDEYIYQKGDDGIANSWLHIEETLNGQTWTNSYPVHEGSSLINPGLYKWVNKRGNDPIVPWISNWNEMGTYYDFSVLSISSLTWMGVGLVGFFTLGWLSISEYKRLNKRDTEGENDKL